MRNRLDSTVLNVIDVGDQPASSYVFIIEGMLGPRQAFAVDGIMVSGEVVTGYLGNQDIENYSPSQDIVSVHKEAPWVLLSRSVLEPYTVKDSILKAASDGKAIQDHEGECLKQHFPDQTITTKSKETDSAVVTPRVDSMGHYL